MIASDFAADVAASAREVLERQAPRGQVLARLRSEPFSPRIWSAGAEVGWFRLLTAGAAGGLEAGPAEVAALFREIGRYLPAGPFLESVVLAGLLRTHADLGADERVLSGGELQDGEALVEFADECDLILLWTRPGGGQAIFAVRPAAARITPLPTFDLVSRPCRVDITGAPNELLLGGDEAAEVLERLDALAAVARTATLAGLSAELLEISVQYAKDRVQFDRPIGAFQAVQHRLAEVAVSVAGLESTLNAASALAETAPADLVAIHALEAAAADSAREVVQSCLQVHGGIGFTDHYRLHVYLKRALRLQALGQAGDPLVALGTRLLSGGR